ncbi:hypothetical protein B0H19DRAFT_1075507 [Mycena capillaripes]|nr:hypothetical protein B0H19DRAFT_1075507 [Mycena capillaripes]
MANYSLKVRAQDYSQGVSLKLPCISVCGKIERLWNFRTRSCRFPHWLRQFSDLVPTTNPSTTLVLAFYPVATRGSAPVEFDRWLLKGINANQTRSSQKKKPKHATSSFSKIWKILHANFANFTHRLPPKEQALQNMSGPRDAGGRGEHLQCTWVELKTQERPRFA